MVRKIYFLILFYLFSSLPTFALENLKDITFSQLVSLEQEGYISVGGYEFYNGFPLLVRQDPRYPLPFYKSRYVSREQVLSQLLFFDPRLAINQGILEEMNQVPSYFEVSDIQVISCPNSATLIDMRVNFFAKEETSGGSNHSLLKSQTFLLASLHPSLKKLYPYERPKPLEGGAGAAGVGLEETLKISLPQVKNSLEAGESKNVSAAGAALERVEESQSPIVILPSHYGEGLLEYLKRRAPEGRKPVCFTSSPLTTLKPPYLCQKKGEESIYLLVQRMERSYSASAPLIKEIKGDLFEKVEPRKGSSAPSCRTRREQQDKDI